MAIAKRNYILNLYKKLFLFKTWNAIREINGDLFCEDGYYIAHCVFAEMPPTFGKIARKSFVLKLLKHSPCSDNLGSLQFWGNKMFN